MREALPIDKIVINTKALRVKSERVTREQIEDLRLQERLIAATRTAWIRGYGLAAIQIGLPLRYGVYYFEGRWHELINPEITNKKNEWFIPKEGCLSIPGIFMPVKRYSWIVYTNDNIVCKAQDLEAEIIQHEVDHMNGILIWDRTELPKKEPGRNEPCPCGSNKKYKKCCALKKEGGA